MVVDGAGKFLTPGVIDVHSHLGVYPAPGVSALSDGNEATNPATPQVWAEHSVWPQDAAFPRNLAGGVTTLQALPGSANLIGGRSVVLKVVPARTVQGMKFPGAKYGLKMACGENPKRVYSQRGPSTRMGNVAGYREQWIKAERYRRQWDAWLAEPEKGPARPRSRARDAGRGPARQHPRAEPLLSRRRDGADDRYLQGVRLQGALLPSCRRGLQDRATCSRKEQISTSVWADWGGFKMESIDAVRANAALVHAAGGRAVIHSDSADDSQRLNQEAAKAMAAGRAIGLTISEDDAIKWITANAAWTLGLEDRIGTIEKGKNADLVLWSANPFSVYAHAEKVWIDGALRLDRTRSRIAMADRLRAGIRPCGERRDEPGSLFSAALTSRQRSSWCRSHLRRDDCHCRRQGLSRLRRPDRGRHRPDRGWHDRGGRHDVAIPAGARQIDAKGKWVTPGLVHSATTLGMVEVDAVDESDDSRAKGDRGVAAAVRVWDALNPEFDIVGAGARGWRHAGCRSARRRLRRRPGGARRNLRRLALGHGTQGARRHLRGSDGPRIGGGPVPQRTASPPPRVARRCARLRIAAAGIRVEPGPARSRRTVCTWRLSSRS